MTDKTENKEEKLRGQIIEQATKLFKIFGYNKLVMEDIARAVGKRRTTLYIYYKDKDAIFNAVVENELQEYLQSLDEEIPKTQSATEKLLLFLKIKFEFRNKKAAEYPPLTHEMTRQPEILTRMRVFSDPAELKHLAEIIGLGIVSGEFKKMDEQEIDLTTHLIISAMDGISNEVTANLSTIDVESVFNGLSKLFISALEQKSQNFK